MSAYVFGHIRITDDEKWMEYKTKVQATLEPYGGKVLLRAEHIESFVGDTKYPDVVVIEFDSRERAKGWYTSDAYQSLIAIRDQGAELLLHLYG